MRRHLVIAAALTSLTPWATAASASGWLFRPSYYSHAPASGDRVMQYEPPPRVFVRTDPTYFQSAYRHNCSSLQVGGSYDHLHIVETWGAGALIRPYGEWEYPYRPGATPYGPWGNPSGPWTLPFDSWVNPYGLGKLPHPPWPHYGPYLHPPGPWVSPHAHGGPPPSPPGG